jgi:hypothetical protein
LRLFAFPSDALPAHRADPLQRSFGRLDGPRMRND